MRHDFVDERALMTMRSISFCHWKKTCIFLKEKTWKRIYDTNSELSQNKTEKQIRSYKAKEMGYLMIYHIIYSLLVLTEKLTFFNN